MQNHAAWIWHDREIIPDSYAAFRRTFVLEAVPENPILTIAADSEFSLFVNGKCLPGSQFADFPTEKSSTNFDLSGQLVAGKNVISVLVHYIGHNFFRDVKGYPGLYLMLADGGEILLGSDEKFRSVPAPGYRSGWQQMLTFQLGFCTWFDAREAGALEWTDADFDDSKWSFAKNIDADFDRTLSPRPLPKLLEKVAPTVVLIQQGVLRRAFSSDRVALEMFNDFLRPMNFRDIFSPETETRFRAAAGEAALPDSATLVIRSDARDPQLEFRPLTDPETNGYYLIFELPQEIVGYITFDLTASAGTVVDYSLGEHLFSGRVRAAIEDRNFADRYIAREGRNRFTMRMRRAAGRYLELHFTGCAAPPQLFYAGVLEQSFPLPEMTPFECGNRLIQKTVQIAVDTMKNCMHEHYEDCPWREQSLYGYDSRNQALYGYYIWGNYDFAATSFRLLGHSRGKRFGGFLAMTEPSDVPLTIPIFSLAWVSAIYEHYLHSGDLALFRTEAETVKSVLAAATRYRTGSGLYYPGDDPEFWHFAEWVPGLSQPKAKEFAPYNLYLYESLTLAEKLFAAAGLAAPDYAAMADELGEKIERIFYCPERGLYASDASDATIFHEHTQALMLYLDLVPDEKRAGFMEKLLRRDTIKCTFSALPFLIRALMREPELRDFAAQIVADSFESMVTAGATTLWETPNREEFNGAVSLCHAWSSLPAYFVKRYILGVEPLAPGFAKFAVDPYPGSLAYASGSVPTPYGEIRVSWQKTASGVDIKVDNPPGTRRVKS